MSIAQPVFGVDVLQVRLPSVVNAPALSPWQNIDGVHRLTAAFGMDSIVCGLLGAGRVEPFKRPTHPCPGFVKMHGASVSTRWCFSCSLQGATCSASSTAAANTVPSEMSC